MSYGRRAKRIKLDSSTEIEPGGAEFFGLPEELIVRILSYLRVHELCRCAFVCSQWRRFSHADSLWQRWYRSFSGQEVFSWRDLVQIRYQAERSIDALIEAMTATQGGHRRSLLFLYPFDKNYTNPEIKYDQIYESVFKVSWAEMKGIIGTEINWLLRDEDSLAQIKPTAANWLRTAVQNSLVELPQAEARNLLLEMLKYEGDYNDASGIVASTAAEQEDDTFFELRKILSRNDDEDDDQDVEGIASGVVEAKRTAPKALTTTQLTNKMVGMKRWFSDEEAKRCCDWMLRRFPAHRARFAETGPMSPVFRYYARGLICISNNHFALYWIEASSAYSIA